MFIQTESTADPAQLKFLPDHQVLGEGFLHISDKAQAGRSPLAERLFAIHGVSAVSLSKDAITVTKIDGDWRDLKPAILGAIVEHFQTETPALRQSADSDVPISDPVQSVGETFFSANRIKEALRRVIDPELGYNIVDLGLVYDIVIEAGGVVRITMTTTTPGCPATNYLKQGAGDSVIAVEGVEYVEVKLTYEPHWTPEAMSAEAKAHFGIG